MQNLGGPNCPTSYGQAVNVTQIGSDTSLRVTIKRWMSSHNGTLTNLHLCVCQSRRTTLDLAKHTNVKSAINGKLLYICIALKTPTKAFVVCKKMETVSAYGLIYQFSGLCLGQTWTVSRRQRVGPAHLIPQKGLTNPPVCHQLPVLKSDGSKISMGPMVAMGMKNKRVRKNMDRIGSSDLFVHEIRAGKFISF